MKTDKLQETHRLVFLAKATLNGLEICVSKLRTGFLDDKDYQETKATLTRLDSEIKQLAVDTENGLDGSTPT